jgi:hypothetical protein
MMAVATVVAVFGQREEHEANHSLSPSSSEVQENERGIIILWGRHE